MLLRTRWLTLPVAALAATGCRSTCCHKVSPPASVVVATRPPAAYAPRPAAEVLPPAAPPVIPARPAPVPAAPPAPPPSFPPAPSNFGVPPAAPAAPAPESVAPAPATAAPPPAAPVPDTTPPPPVMPTPAKPDAPAKLLEPEFGGAATAEPPAAKADESPVKPAAPATPAPPQTVAPPLNPPAEAKSSPAATLPVGIANFENALEGRVTAGRKPDLDGVKWLKQNGTRTVLLLRRPTEPDDGDRKVFAEAGIKFVSLDVSAAGLTAAKSDEFNRLVADAANHPLFVYDADGTLAGPLWYLYFRRVEGLGDEAARVRAGRLGLKTDATAGEQKALWEAVQRLLN